MTEPNRLGRYEIEALLGSGAYASVYRAVDRVLNRTVALKILKPALLADTQAVLRFKLEAQTMANLMHPHIAWVWDLGQVEDRFFIAMRYVDGPSLDRILADRGTFTFGQALGIIEQVIDALEYAHRNGLVHRDVKPQNIILSEQDGAVVTDFGLVRALESSGLSTGSGAIIGTPHYIAPEVWKGEGAAPAADQYAVACVLVELLTRQKLFAAPTPPAVMMKHFEPVVWPVNWPPDTPPSIELVVNKALAKEAAGRYPTVSGFAQALHEAVATQFSAIEKQQADERRAALMAAAEQKLADRDGAAVLLIASELLANQPDDADARALPTRLFQGLQAAEAQRRQQAIQDQARRDAEEQKRREAEEHAQRAAEEKRIRQEAEALAEREAQERQRQETEAAALAARLRQEAEEQSQRATMEERLRQEAEDRAKREAQARQRQEIEVAALAANLRREAEEHAQRKVEDQARASIPVLQSAAQSEIATKPAQSPAIRKPQPRGGKRAIVIGSLVLLSAVAIITLMAITRSTTVSMPPPRASALMAALPATTTPVSIAAVVAATSTSTLTPVDTATAAPTTAPTATATHTLTATPTHAATMKPSATVTRTLKPTTKATQAPKQSFPTVPPSDKPYIGVPSFNPPCGSTINRASLPQYPRMFVGYAPYSGIGTTLRVVCLDYGVENNGTKHLNGSMLNGQTTGVAKPDRGQVSAECYPFNTDYASLEFVIGLVPEPINDQATAQDYVANSVATSVCRYTVTP